MTDPPGKTPGESQIIEMDECYPSNDASLLKNSNLDFFFFFVIDIIVVFLLLFLTNNNDKPSDQRLDIEGAGRTPLHEHEGCSMVGCTVKPVAIRNCFL